MATFRIEKWVEGGGGFEEGACTENRNTCETVATNNICGRMKFCDLGVVLGPSHLCVLYSFQPWTKKAGSRDGLDFC